MYIQCFRNSSINRKQVIPYVELNRKYDNK